MKLAEEGIDYNSEITMLASQDQPGSSEEITKSH